MTGFLATFRKELLLLLRDRAGLLVLFLMPTVLVLVVSLVQNNILETTGGQGLKVLLVDLDGGELGRRIAEELAASEGFLLERPPAGEAEQGEAAREAVAAGRYPFAVVIPAEATNRVRELAGELARGAPAGTEGPDSAGGPAIEVFFDPTVQGAFRTAVLSSLRLATLQLETETKISLLAEKLSRPAPGFPAMFPIGLGKASGEGTLPSAGRLSAVLLPARETAAVSGKAARLPTAVQQNVPAWALFGMFFIVVPLAGTLLRERQEGTLQRLRTIAVSPLGILAGKIAAYVLVCLAQFGLMLLVGKVVLPLFGTPVLELGEHPGAVFLLALAAALAAAGFGILVGTAAGSYEQASMAGAVSVVIAAAVGGVMVPVYVMPRAMQAISVLSPLAWGLDGFLDLFVRGGDFFDVFPNVLLLLGFFAGTLLAARIVLLARSRRGV